MRALIWSPPRVYRSRHGEPNGSTETQSWARSEKPMSLPPIVNVTSRLSLDSESSCGGFGPPGETFWGANMSAVSAPLQVASRYSAKASVRCAIRP